MKKPISFLSIFLSASLLFSGCALRPEAANGQSAAESVSVRASSTESGSVSIEDFAATEDFTVTEDAATTEKKSTAPVPGDSESAPFSATMLNVGQGLSVLIQSDGHNMLYDGGNRAHSSYVVAYLQQHGIDFLDYMVASHYDEDHIAGLVGVLNTTPVSTILCPDYQADSKIYESFVKGEGTSGAQIEHPDAGEEYLLGDAKIEVLQDDPTLEEANNKSIAVKVSYGTFSMLLTGDAEEEAEEEMIRSGQDLHADLYVAGHHGSSSSSSQDFLTAVSPSYVWISCGADNSYGHPHKETMEKLEEDGIQMFRTDRQGEVSVYADGNSYWFSTAPSDDWKSGNEETAAEGKDSTAATEETVTSGSGENGQESADTYILNTHTLKFHRTDCEAVEKMSEQNKEVSHLSREELIGQGYSPCGACRP